MLYGSTSSQHAVGSGSPLFTENPRRRVFSETKLPEMPILGSPEAKSRGKEGIKRGPRLPLRPGPIASYRDYSIHPPNSPVADNGAPPRFRSGRRAGPATALRPRRSLRPQPRAVPRLAPAPAPRGSASPAERLWWHRSPRTLRAPCQRPPPTINEVDAFKDTAVPTRGE